MSLGHSGGGLRAAPAVRALAHKLGVELAMVTPSGRDGIITTADVQRVARILSETEPAEPLRGFRRVMAQNMALAQSEVAAATIMDDADVEAWRAGADTTIRLIRALVAGCRAEPALNAWFESEALARRVLNKIDLGIAIDLPEGLFVPVLRNVGARDAADLREGLDRMRADVAARRIPPEELRGAHDHSVEFRHDRGPICRARRDAPDRCDSWCWPNSARNRRPGGHAARAPYFATQPHLRSQSCERG